MKEGIVLFAHGSRDPQWAEPFEQICARLRSTGFEVRLAYLESMRPDLGEAVAALALAGAHAIRIVPAFLGTGGHVKEDLPRLVAEAARAHPDVKLKLDKPIGEQPVVIDAIAQAIAAR